MSGGRERDSGVHDRTINETSSEEDQDAAQNPLGVITEGNEGNAEAINPIQVAGNPNPNPENSDDDMANNTVKPGQLTALLTFDGERGEGFTNWLECLENANDTYQWPPSSLIQVVKPKEGHASPNGTAETDSEEGILLPRQEMPDIEQLWFSDLDRNTPQLPR